MNIIKKLFLWLELYNPYKLSYKALKLANIEKYILYVKSKLSKKRTDMIEKERNEAEDAMYESLTENFNELQCRFDGSNTMQEILEERKICLPDNLSIAPTYQINLGGLDIFRAREGVFNTSDITQFGYIQNAAKVNMLRLNKAGQQVLYTSTDPITAYKELDCSGNNKVYISRWKMKKQGQFNVALTIMKPKASIDQESITSHYLKIMNKKMKDSQLFYFQSIGDLLERQTDSTENIAKYLYIMTSDIADHIFKNNDVILTASTKDYNNLNLTFKKAAADLLEILCIYELDNPRNHGGKLCDCELTGIGLPNYNTNKVNWCSPKVDVNGLSVVDNPLVDITKLQAYINNNKRNIVVRPNFTGDVKDANGIVTGFGSYSPIDVKVKLI